MMENIPLPVFNIEPEEDEEGDGCMLDAAVTKPIEKCDPLHRLLANRSINPPSNSPNLILKKLEVIAEDNLLRKDLMESVRGLPFARPLSQESPCEVYFEKL